jgi:hypothetical protein
MLKYSPQLVKSKYLIKILIGALVVKIFKRKLSGFVLLLMVEMLKI